MKTFSPRFLPVLSFALLAFQVYIPWSVKHLVTQDGPSHIYTAYVTKDLIFHRHTSPYHSVHRVQKTALPNWTGTILLAGYLSAFGPDRAEAFLMTVCLLAGYAGFAYCARALSPGRGVSLLLGNCLLQPWFLWGGFYNFYLGMALFLAVTGYYVSHGVNLTWKRAFTIALGLLAVFFTHLIPAILTGVTLCLLGAWLHRSWRSFAMLAAALCPTVALTIQYALTFQRNTSFVPGMRAAFLDFPQKTFVFANGWVGEQKLMWPVALLAIAAAIVSMKGKEWKTARGAIAIAACAAFVFYLLIPDIGFGGSVVKMRFTWAFFLLGGVLVSVADRLRPLQVVLGASLSVLLLLHLGLIAGHVKATSEAAELYLSAMDKLPQGARFVRFFYAAPALERRFATDQLAFNPLEHLEALGAVRRHAVDLSDYQAATGTFSVVFKPAVDEGKSASLWAFESPNAKSWASLDWLRGNLPVSIDYAVVFGEDVPAEMEARGTLVGVNPGAPSVRIYKLLPASAKRPIQVDHRA